MEGLNLIDYNPDMSKTGDLLRPPPLKTPSAQDEALSSELFSQMSPAPQIQVTEFEDAAKSEISRHDEPAYEWKP